MPDDIAVIVPVWNGRALVERLLMSVRAQTHPVAETLIVDNGSEDGAPEVAQQLGARVIRMGSNAGFARAVNRGIQECTTEWLAIINSDVELAPNWLERLLEAARTSDAWFATGKILSARRRDCVDGTYDALCRGGCAWRVGQGRSDGPEFSCPRDIWSAPGTAALFRTELFRRLGPLDEMFESYLEDVEFGLRCACLNYAGRYVPDAICYHLGSAALGKWHPGVVRKMARNQVLLVAKHYPRRLLFGLAWPILVSQSLWGLVALRHGAFLAFLAGKIEGLKSIRKARRRAPGLDIPPDRLAQVLLDSEREIRRVQRLTGLDWYWRVYFLLTSGGAD
ncbi:MAG: glycosyltransferase family 2 protein [Acidobacteriia bacterium]|nr:glycosyltransferase family 2 protein [Terriglobia bacterium]